MDMPRPALAVDLRAGLRQLAKSPGVAGVAVLSLALGIGANTAVFSVINDVLLRSLPVKDPAKLVLFRNVQGPGGSMSRAGENNSSIDPETGRDATTSFSLLAFERFREHHPALSDVFAYAPLNDVNLLVDGQPETSVLGQLVSGNYYEGLGVSAILGRTLLTADDQPSADPVAVISSRYWKRRFGGDPSVMGKTVQVNRVPVTLVGVTPPGFAGAMQIGESVDITVPLSHHARFQPERAPSRAQPWYWWIRIMGRLAPGASPAQAHANLEPIFQEAAREGWRASQALDTGSGAGKPAPPTLVADPGGQGEDDARRRYRPSLRILMGLVGLVLLAACVNVANLLLARGATRRREIALRLALGASRVRIVRQLLTESFLLAIFGTALGVLFAYWGRGMLVALRQFGGSSVVLDLHLDGGVLGFTIAVAIATTLLSGLAPALRSTRLSLGVEFQGGARQLGAWPRSRLRQGLMVAQIALSLVLLVGTGLFVRTLRNLQSVDPGFNPHNLVLFRIDADSAGYRPEQFAGVHTRIQERLAGIPGVRAATFSNVELLAGVRSSRRLSVVDRTPTNGASGIFNTNGVAPNFFEAMQIPLLLGRAFSDHDSIAAPRVAIINQALARKLFDDDNPIGHRLLPSTLIGGGEIEIVGMVRDAKYTGLREEAPATAYLPAAQQLDGSANYCARVAGDPGAVSAAIRAAVRDVDATLPVINLRTQDEQIERITSQERLFAWLSGCFGLVALVLACVGLHGLVSYVVVRRTGEIGLRMALGALPAQVLWVILRESMALVALGTVLGIVAAYGVSRVLGSMLFGLSPGDPLTYVAVALGLVGVALAASLHPARYATRIDPLVALRAE